MNSNRRFIRRTILTSLAACFLPCVAHSQSWNVALGDWANPANWNPAAVPNGNPANISNGGTAQVNSVVASIPSTILVGNGPVGVGRVDIRNGGNLTVAPGGATVLGYDNGAGTLNIANTAVATPGTVSGFGVGDGSITTGDFAIGGTIVGVTPHPGTGTANINTTGTIVTRDAGIGVGPGSVGTLNFELGTWTITGPQGLGIGVAGGTGTANIAGGSVSVTNALALGYGLSVPGSSGTLNLANTALAGPGISGFGLGSAGLTVGGTLFVGGTGAGDVANGLLNVNTSGALSLQQLQIGNGGLGVVNFESGAMTSTGIGVGYANGGAGTSELKVAGGTIANSGAITVGQGGGSGKATVSGGAITSTAEIRVGAAGSTGDLVMSGGTLTATDDAQYSNQGFNLARGAGAVGSLNLSGGTISASIIQLGSDGGTATVNISGTGALNALQGSNNDQRNYINVGEGNGMATINQTGGSVAFGTWMAVGLGGGTTVPVYNVSGGTVTGGGLEIGSDRSALFNVSGNASVTPGAIEVGVRDGGNGTMTINSPTAVVAPGSVSIASRGATSVGVVTLTDGTLAPTGDLLVGNVGNGMLTQNGGSLSANVLNVAANAGAQGLVNFNGGTAVINEIYMGNGAGAVGTVNVNNTALVQNGWAEVGRNGGTATININGPAASFTHTPAASDFQLGYNGGTGTVNVTNGGTFVHNWWLNLGRGAGSNGNLNIDGPGSKVLVGAAGGIDAKMNIGEDGNGTVTLTNGGYLQVSANATGGAELYVGRNAGSNGRLNVRSGSEVQANGNWAMIVGEAGGSNGRVDIESGGKVKSNNWIVIGNNAGATGEVNIQDTGSLLESGTPAGGAHEGRLIVGRLGTARLNQSGGTVRADNWLAIGIDPGGNGTYNMTGGEIVLAQPNFGDRNIIVGNTGTGVMNITHGTPAGDSIRGIDGGQINYFNVAGDSGGKGTLNIALDDPAAKIVSRELYAGWNNGSDGTINITQGTLQTNEWVEIGRGPNGGGGKGTVNVDGPNAVWNRGVVTNQRQDMQFGQGDTTNTGKGYLNVLNGGTVNHNWWINLARQATAEGHITIDGAGSTINILPAPDDRNAQINIGENGLGTMTITNGGKFNHMVTHGGGEIYVSRNGTANGTLTVDGAGSEFNARSREFRVANDGTGVMNITNGGFVNFRSTDEAAAQVNGNFGVAQYNNAKGTINMDNGTLSISAWSMFGAWEDSAANSEATVNMANNSAILLPNDTGDHGRLLWGRRGQATINQSGGLVSVANWAVLGVEAGGRGNWNVTDGGLAELGNELNIGRAGGTGSMIVTGNANGNPLQPSTVHAVGNVFVGRDGAGSTGTLTIADGARGQFDNEFNIGQGGGGSTGVVNVAGAGTIVSVNGWITMGRDTGGSVTTSTLNVTDGALFQHLPSGGGDFLLGWQAGSTANVNVTGGGKIIHNWWFRAGIDPGSVGNVVVDGPGSSITRDTGRTYIGERGTGTLTVSSGGRFIQTNSDQFNVGGNDASANGEGEGTLTVTGAGSLVSTDNFLRVGFGNTGADPAHGVLNITDGGKVNVTGWFGAGHEGGDGAVNIDGGTLQVLNELHVGIDDNGHTRQSTGVVNVVGDGKVDTGIIILGRNGGKGDINVDSGSLVVHRETFIGQGGIGAGGGRSEGTLNILGTDASVVSEADVFFRLGVGGGKGTLNVIDGGTLNTNVGWLTLGENDGSEGNAIITGAGSKVTANGIIVGWNGTGVGNMTITDGGYVLSTGREVSIGRDNNVTQGTINILNGGTLSGRDLRIGHNGKGTVNVDHGTLHSDGGWAIVADGGTSVGNLNIVDGVFDHPNDSLMIGNNPGANGTMTQTGASSSFVGGEVNLGRNGGIGVLNVDGGTFKVNGWTTMGRDGNNGTGTINVSNGGFYDHSQFGGDGLFGWTGGSTGNVNVVSGGRMVYNWWVRLAVDPGSTGNLLIDGPGSRFDQAPADNRFLVGEGGTGSLTVTNGGALTVGNGLTIGGNPSEADAGTGTMIVAGGTVGVRGEINFGFNAGATGTGIVDSGSVYTNSWFIVGRSGNATYNQSGGRVWNTAQELRVGNDASGVGIMNVSGGTFSSATSGMIGEAGNGTLNVTGGVISMGCDAGDLFIAHLNGSKGVVTMLDGQLIVPNGSVEFNTQGGALTSTLNLNGGILATRYLNNPTTNPVALVSASGGTLRAVRDEADFIRGFSASQLVLGSGGLTIDTNDHTVTVNSVFSGAGGITKSGFGQLNLTRNQVNTGNTAVRSGVLNLDFSAALVPSDLVANTGLVLGGGTLRITSTAVPNSQTFATTEIASGSSRVETQESGAGVATVALGAITRPGAGGTVDIGQPTAGSITTSTANTNGILGGYATVNGLTWAKNDGTGKIVGLADADYSAALGATANFDTLKAGGGILGGGSVNSIRFARNGSDTIGLTSNLSVGSGGILVTAGVGANNSIIGSAGAETLTSGNGRDLIVIQNNTAGNAVIASQITGAIALTKSGPGILALGNNGNDYTGGTYINSGALVIGADSALGAPTGGITFAAPSLATGGVLATTATMTIPTSRAITLNSGGGGLSVASGTTLTVGSNIAGAGGLGKLGAGTLVLNGNSTYTGATAIFEGNLQLNGSLNGTAGFTTNGDLILGAGANIASSGPITIADGSGSLSHVTLTDANITGSDVTFGGQGSAIVTMNGLSTIAATCDLIIAGTGTSNSIFNVNAGGSVIGQQNTRIGVGGTGVMTMTDASLQVGNQLAVGVGGGTGTLNLTGTTAGQFGTLEVANGGTGTINISGNASLNAAGGDGYINVGNNNVGNALVNQTGGSVNYNSWMTIGIGAGSTDPSNSKYLISGGKLTSGAGVEVGSDHGGTFDISGTAEVNLGSVSIGTYGDRGGGAAGNGFLRISGGTLTTNEINVGHNANNGGLTSNGVYQQTGGVTTVNGTLFVARNANSTGTANLDGGTLRVNGISRGLGGGQLNLNGTTIIPNATNGNFITGFDTTNSEIQAGGAVFNTDGKNIRVDTSFDGVGALTKNGDGKMTLGGDSAFNGGVNLNAGILSIRHDHALGTGTLVANGGILSFDNISGNGLIEGRISSTNAFDTTSPIPVDGFTLGTPKANTTDQALFGYNTTWGYRGTLVVPAGGATWSFAEQFDDSVLLKIDGDTILNDGTWNNPTQGTRTLTAGEHTFELRVGQGGGGVGPNNGWAIGFGVDFLGRGTVDPANYVAMQDPGNGSLFRYNDEGGINYNVANAVSLLVPTQVNVSQYGATLAGNITGPGGINKVGAGRLTLAGTNTYAAPTNIDAGVLEVGAGGLTGTLGVGNVNNQGTLRFNRDGVLSVSNVINGAGSVEQTGPGVTVLSGVNPYTGATTINAGTLRVTGSISGSSLTTINPGGTLSGTGAVGATLLNGGTLAPGASPGILSTANTTFNGGTFAVEILGLVAGTEYDQLNVTGTFTFQSNTALSLNFGAFIPALNNSFTIVSNDGTDPILGGGLFTVAGTPIPEGYDFNDFGNNTALNIDYSGGTDGNDIVLTVVPEPGSLSMIGLGLAFLVGRRRRKIA